MKWIGIVLLSLGVAISAAYGSRLTPTIRSQLTVRGRAQFLAAREGELHAAYCRARQDASLGLADGCVAEDAEPAPFARAECAQGDPAPSPEQIDRCRLQRLRERDEVLSPTVAGAREAWLAAFDESIPASARAAALRPMLPQDRVQEWYAGNGLFFLLGLALVVAGAVVGRIAVRRDVEREGKEAAAKEGARDLGVLLSEAQAELAAMRDLMSASDDPTGAQHDQMKDRLNELSVSTIETVVASGPRVQARYGMGNYAELFGPFSSAERYINRAWSALVDRHWPEALASVTRAHDDIAATRAILDRLSKR